MSSFVFAANWKLNKKPSEARSYLKRLVELGAPASGHQVLVFPSMTSLHLAAEILPGGSIGWGPQNVHWTTSGAYTGETSVAAVAEMGAQFALVGHSERRQYFAETDERVAKKVRLCQENALTPLICIGETLAEREAGRTAGVIQEQLRRALELRLENQPVMIAYEPVWAIGTGQVASPAQVGEVHQQIRRELADLNMDGETPILYGGSVNAENLGRLLAVPEVNGFLVGGASLDAEGFAAMIRQAK